MSFFTVNIIAELACFLTALLVLWRQDMWRMQILYMFLVCATEILGRYLLKGIGETDNSWLYNIYLLIEAFFIVFMFYHLLQGKIKYLNLYLGIFIVIFALSYAYDFLFHGFMVFNTNCNTIVSSCYCIMGMYYFYWLMNREEYTDILGFAPFWWVGGVILYYFGSTVLNIFQDALIHAKDHTIRRYMIQFINVVLYGSWSYSFILKRWSTKN